MIKENKKHHPSTAWVQFFSLRTLASGCSAAIFLMGSGQALAVSCFAKMPTAVPIVTSNFGMRRHPKIKNADGSPLIRPHDGTDLRARINTPLYAVDDGMTIGSTGPKGDAGNMITLLLTNGTQVVYMHSNRIFVRKGDAVKAGQQIADSGNTGSASAAPHLHFEVIPQGMGKVDARPYLCNPSEDSHANDSAVSPTTVASGSPVTNGIPNNNLPPMGSGPAVTTQIPQASIMPDYVGMTLHEFLSNESARRFGNAQWQRDINDPLDVLRHSPDPAIRAAVESAPIGDIDNMLWREVLFMMMVKDIYAMEKYERRERIENMFATDLADQVNDYTQKVLSTLRAQASQAPR